MRRNSLQVMIGHVPVGGGLANSSPASVVVQSMTNTDTADAQATTKQVYELWQAGSEVVRITVNSPEAAAQVGNIRAGLDALGCNVPLVGDFHFNGHKLLKAHPACAEGCLRFDGDGGVQRVPSGRRHHHQQRGHDDAQGQQGEGHRQTGGLGVVAFHL